MDQKKELGKGIRALLGTMDEQKPRPVVSPKPSTVEAIPIEYIEANPAQPRNEFESQSLLELAETIKIHGLIQPVAVRKISDKRYQLISGERRTRAAKLAGLKEIPAYIRTADDQGLLEMALIENIQRENLNAIEVAISMARLIEECKLTHEEMSHRLGKDRTTVTNHLRLLKLPPDIQLAVKTRQISMGHARALAGVENLLVQLKLFKDTILHQWSVRHLESAIQSYSSKITKRQISPAKPSDPHLKKYTDHSNAVFGRRTSIKADAAGRGHITVPFNGLDDLEALLERLS
jgi:ParB family transcriptional regulator, chromosome partitioning protein